jgi:hypothetical protein
MLKAEEVKKQSEGAVKQWGPTWEKHSKINGEILKEKGFSNLRVLGHGIGKKLILVAFGAELEKQVEYLTEENESVDIACVDKAFGYLLDNKVKPDFVYLADAGIDYSKWCEPWIEQTEDIILFMNVTANPEWAKNWKGKVFYFVNEDNIKTHETYGPISGCKELVKASSNVGNSVLVHAETYLMYDAYYLVGYDFMWSDGNYYCNHDSDKRWYMNHYQILTPRGKLVSTSQNLLFSARWLMDFIKAILLRNKKKIFVCGDSLLDIPQARLDKILKDSVMRPPNQNEIDFVINNRAQTTIITHKEKDGPEKLNETLKTKNVLDVVVRHLPDDLFAEATC